MKRAMASMLVLLVLPLAIAGCREQRQSDSDAPPAPPAATPAATESPDTLAARAQAAMEKSKFNDAGEFFFQAAESSDPENAVSDEQRFDWRCRSMLCYWLGAGGGDLARPIFHLDIHDPFADSAIAGLPDVQSSRNDYAVALWRAMALYEELGGSPSPDDKILVLDIAAALQAKPVAGSPEPSDARLPADWPTLARLPRAMSAWAAMDAGSLNLGAYQVAALMTINDAAATRPDDWQPPETLHLGRMIQPRPAPAGQTRPVEDWLLWFSQRSASNSAPNGATLRISIRRHPQVVACVEAKVSWANGQAKLEYLQCRGKAEAARLSAGLKVLAAAMPDGATAVDTRQQADLVAATLERFTGQAGPARVQPQDNFFWVMPAKSHGGELIPLVASWLAGRDWRPPETASATTQPEDMDDPSLPGPSEP
jgi:hypothetical protein